MADTGNGTYQEQDDRPGETTAERVSARLLGSHIDLRASYGRGDGGENTANHRRLLRDPGSCEVPRNGTLTRLEWERQQNDG